MLVSETVAQPQPSLMGLPCLTLPTLRANPSGDIDLHTTHQHPSAAVSLCHASWTCCVISQLLHQTRRAGRVSVCASPHSTGPPLSDLSPVSISRLGRCPASWIKMAAPPSIVAGRSMHTTLRPSGPLTASCYSHSHRNMCPLLQTDKAFPLA